MLKFCMLYSLTLLSAGTGVEKAYRTASFLGFMTILVNLQPLFLPSVPNLVLSVVLPQRTRSMNTGTELLAPAPFFNWLSKLIQSMIQENYFSVSQRRAQLLLHFAFLQHSQKNANPACQNSPCICAAAAKASLVTCPPLGSICVVHNMAMMYKLSRHYCFSLSSHFIFLPWLCSRWFISSMQPARGCQAKQAFFPIAPSLPRDAMLAVAQHPDSIWATPHGAVSAGHRHQLHNSTDKGDVSAGDLQSSY